MKYLLLLPTIFCSACFQTPSKPVVEAPFADQQAKAVATVSSVTKQDLQCAEADVSKFIQTFIQLYAEGFFKHGNEKAKLQNKFFTKTFYDKVYCGRTPETVDSEKCLMDDDPVLCAQDWDKNWTKTLRITRIKRTSDKRCKAALSFNTGNSRHKLTYFLAKDGQEYLIDGVEWIQ